MKKQDLIRLKLILEPGSRLKHGLEFAVKEAIELVDKIYEHLPETESAPTRVTPQLSTNKECSTPKLKKRS